MPFEWSFHAFPKHNVRAKLQRFLHNVRAISAIYRYNVRVIGALLSVFYHYFAAVARFVRPYIAHP